MSNLLVVRRGRRIGRLRSVRDPSLRTVREPYRTGVSGR